MLYQMIYQSMQDFECCYKLISEETRKLFNL